MAVVVAARMGLVWSRPAAAEYTTRSTPADLAAPEASSPTTVATGAARLRGWVEAAATASRAVPADFRAVPGAGGSVLDPAGAGGFLGENGAFTAFASAGGGGGGGFSSGGGGGRTQIDGAPDTMNRGGSGGGGGGSSRSPGDPDATFENGVRSGNGLVVISYVQPFPDPPENVSATVGNGQATVSFDPPAYTGTTPITSYLAICGNPDAGPSNTGTSSPIVVSGLPNGVPVTCIVQAVNDAGHSGHSTPSNPVTPTAPAGVPGAPTGVNASRGEHAGDGELHASRE